MLFLKNLFNKGCKTDFTHSMVGKISDLSRPVTGDSVHARALTSDELVELSKNPDYDLTHSVAVEGVAQNANRHCFATFNDGVVSAYIFIATGLVTPEMNSAGSGFGGIGMILPANVMYLYKGFTLPKYRGQRQVNIAVVAGADALVDSSGWMISTVETNNAASIKMLENVGLHRQDQLKEYRILGKSFYRIPEVVKLGSVGNENNEPVNLFTSHLETSIS